MAKKKKVWGVAFYGPITRKWWLIVSDACGPFPERFPAEIGKEAAKIVLEMQCAIIPGTVLPDGSIAWPKEWPVP